MRNARTTRRRSVKIGLPAALLVLLIAVFAAGCGGSSDSTTGSDSGSSEAASSTWSATPPPNPSTPKPSSPPSRKASKGAGVSFSNSFGASGDQSRAVAAGQPASVVHFAQAGDMERLVEEGEIVAKDWDQQPYKGIAQDSVVVITVRKGNPDGIKSFDDVLEQGRRRGHPEPVQLRRRALEHHGRLRHRRSTTASRPTRRWPRSRPCSKRRSRSRAAPATRSPPSPRARATSSSATRTRRSRPINEGEDVEYVIPPSTIQIETPIAVTKDAPEPAAAGLPRLHLVR